MQMSRREQLEEMVKADPDDLFLRYALAMACISEGDSAEGLKRLDDVIRRDPDYAAAYFQKGQALAERGATEEARKTITEGIEAAGRTGDEHARAEMSEFLEMLC